MTEDRFALLPGEAYAELTHRAIEFARGSLSAVPAEPEGLEEDERISKEILGLLAREGLLALSVPAAWSGRDRVKAAALAAGTNGRGAGPPLARGSIPDLPGVTPICILREILAYHSGLADLMFVMQGLGSLPIALCGSEELRRRWLPAVARGETIAALAITEPGAGSDLGSIALTARRAAEGYVLDGVKTLISNAPIAGVFSVIARTDGGAVSEGSAATGPSSRSSRSGTSGLSAFAIPADHPGVDRSERIRTIAPHPIGTVRFSGCRIPEAWRLGDEGEGMRIALATLARFRPTVGAAAAGFASRAFDEARTHALSREQFGRPLAEFQGIQAKLADMATEIEAARLLVYRAAAALDRGEPAARESSMAKLFGTEAAARVADEAVQILGGGGLIRGSVVERIYREVRALRIYEGTSEIQRLIIARDLLGAEGGAR